MITKTYRSKIHTSLSFTSYNPIIRFIDGNGRAKCVYTTSNENEQEFIENTDLFKRNLLYIEKTINTEQKQQEEKQEVEDVKLNNEENLEQRTYTNRQDLMEQIKSLFPEEHVVVKTTESELLAIAKKHNLVFQRIQ